MGPGNQHCIFQSWQCGSTYSSIPPQDPTLPHDPSKCPSPQRVTISCCPGTPGGALLLPAPLSHQASLPSILAWGFTPHRCEHRPESQINSEAHAPPKGQENLPLTPLPACLASFSCPFPVLQFPCLQTCVPRGCDVGGAATGMWPAESNPPKSGPSLRPQCHCRRGCLGSGDTGRGELTAARCSPFLARSAGYGDASFPQAPQRLGEPLASPGCIPPPAHPPPPSLQMDGFCQKL